MTTNRLLVYVQAVPNMIPSSAKSLKDLAGVKFKMSHSSKTALAIASSIGSKEIVAAGFGPVLSEAVARGASSTVPVPLIDDPLRQAESIPKESFTHILVGESADWFFSGASLAGILARSRGMGVGLFETGQTIHFKPGSIIVVRDDGDSLANIDIRRINDSITANQDSKEMSGVLTFSKLEESRTELVMGNPREVSSGINRKLRRLIS